MVGCHPAMTSNSCLTFKCRGKKDTREDRSHVRVRANRVDGWSAGVRPNDMGQDVSWILQADWDRILGGLVRKLQRQ